MPQVRVLARRLVRRSAHPVDRERSPSTRVMLHADREASYGQVKELMNTIRRAGFQMLGLVAEKNEPR